ncbi:MAG: nucleotide modification associated domain-containing protein [Dysgonomonas sp.]
MTKEDIKIITDEVSEMLIKKNEDYGSASFDLGLNGNMVHVYDKACRFKSLMEKANKGIEPNFESIEDTLKDLLGYAVIGLLILNKEKHDNK